MTRTQADKLLELIARGWKTIGATDRFRKGAPTRVIDPAGKEHLVRANGEVQPVEGPATEDRGEPIV